IAILAVERVGAVARKPARLRRVVKPTRSPKHPTAPVHRSKGAPLRPTFYREPCLAAAGEDLHHAAHRIGAIDHAAGPPKDLDPVDVLGGRSGPIESTPRLIRGYPVDEDFDVVALPTSQKYGADSAK